MKVLPPSEAAMGQDVSVWRSGEKSQLFQGPIHVSTD
ncbi:hypothetical protein AB205_0213610 [Aquarana catesbeiana]|uniref:Uncharacterized protein n=1 Tax=Aquarana catesbeiana TaxID=8400 RepID=A0A2G9NB15_AQUCT|nr:hypothetical protein AB205_0213610 [Aquarana catesbeiana]PIN88289.1 hypothetical protein AB205_0213610 [Aquarana catesbeiana]